MNIREITKNGFYTYPPIGRIIRTREEETTKVEHIERKLDLLEEVTLLANSIRGRLNRIDSILR